MGPVIDCVEVGLGGWVGSGDVCTGICGWFWSKSVSKMVFDDVFSSFPMLVNFFLCLVLAGRLHLSDTPLLLVTLLLEDMTMYH